MERHVDCCGFSWGSGAGLRCWSACRCCCWRPARWPDSVSRLGRRVEFAAGLTTLVFAGIGAFALLWGGAHAWAATLLRRRRPLGRVLTLGARSRQSAGAAVRYRARRVCPLDSPDQRRTASLRARAVKSQGYGCHAGPRRDPSRASRRRRSRHSQGHRDARLREGRRDRRSRVSFTIELTTPACPVKDQLRDQAATAVRALPGVSDVDVQLTGERALGVRARDRASAAAGVKNVIAVGAGKGGVGKTTVAVNLALALAKLRQPRRHPRRRHLRTERADHARAQRAAHDRRADRSCRPRSTACRWSRSGS